MASPRAAGTAIFENRDALECTRQSDLINVLPEPGSPWVRPDGRLSLTVIASMPFARPDLEILLRRVGAMGAGYPARGTKAE